MSLIGKNVEEQIWNFLKSRGLNDYGVASMMGNMYAESGLSPNNLENTGNAKLGMTDEEYTMAVDSGAYTKEQFIYDGFGYSLPQWTWYGRKNAYYEYAKSKNKSVGDLETALEFLYKELSESYPSVLNTLKNATSVLEASNAVLLNYERPADQSVAVQNKRASYGQKYYDKYAGGVNVSVKTYSKGADVELSANFKSYEFDCHGSGCCGTTLIDDELVEYLQKIRDHFGKKIKITSGYRCPIHNKNIGSGTGSYHAKGKAADIQVEDTEPREVAKYAESIGVLGIGLYETSDDGFFVHIDTRTTKAFWYGQAQAYRSTFGGAVEAPKPVVPQGNPADKIYIVKRGDMLSKIAMDYGMTYQELAAYNGIADPNLIDVGQKIRIPNTASKVEVWEPKIGDVVMYNGNKHYVNANAAVGKYCKGGKATITAIYQLGKSKHPYHLVNTGSGSTVHGWVDAGSFTKA